MNDDRMFCPVCEAAGLVAVTYSDSFRHGDAAVVVHGLEGCKCSACGGEPVLAAQIRRNQVRVADARRAADGLLVSSEIRDARERLGISQQEAAVLFGGGANAFSKYERGEVFQSVAMDRLLRLVVAHPSLLAEMRVMAGVASR